MIRILNRSILNAVEEAIVNPANSFLRHGGGLARVIANAAAPLAMTPEVTKKLGIEGDKAATEALLARSEAWYAEQDAAPNIPTGDAYVTSAGALPFDCIIHAVGPVWGGGHFCEHALLESAYRRAILRMREQRLTSIAFPAISGGIFGFPMEQVAVCASRAFRHNLRPHETAAVYLTSDDEVSIFAAVFGNQGVQYVG